jgi:hypothetical protein
METILACLALYRKWKPHGDRSLPVGQLTPVDLLLVGPLRVQPVFYTYTDQKENLIFHIYMEIQSGAVAKSYMRKCTNSSPYMRRPLVIYDYSTAPF